MNLHGFSFDLGRNVRGDAAILKRHVDRLAEFGFNLMTINLEHRFEYPSAPGAAPPGSLTADTAADLVRYGRDRGIEVVPQPNLIGHCEGLLATERHAYLSADPWQQLPWGGSEQLNLEQPAARDLARALIGDACRAFPGKFLHLGGDEVRQMTCLFPGQPDRQREQLLEQFRFVLGLARETGRQILMWGDMLLHHEAILESVPRETIVCDWHYGPQGSRDTLERLQANGFRVLACPAVDTFSGFGPRLAESSANIARMIGDARDLALEGFLLTSWEFGFGCGSDLVWPWVAMAAAIARGEPVTEPDAFLAEFAARRYGVDGGAFVRLHHLLDDELAATIGIFGGTKLAPRQLRKELFRGAYPVASALRPAGWPANEHQQLWEPSPFQAWLFLRPGLDEAALRRFDLLGRESSELAGRLVAGARRNPDELAALGGLGRSLAVLADRLRILQTAHQHYHRAAEAQSRDPAGYRRNLDDAIGELEKLEPGIETLEDVVGQIDRTTGLDPGEKHWLAIHRQSLRDHVAALRDKPPAADSLLEFGEFLRRPAAISQRLWWR